MGQFFSAVTLCVALLTLSPASAEAADFSNHGTVTAKRKGNSVSIVIEAKKGWYVNILYNTKVTLGTTVLRKKDAKFEEKKSEDKAKRAVFRAKDKATSKGEVKAVFCNANSCTSPLKTTFKISGK